MCKDVRPRDGERGAGDKDGARACPSRPAPSPPPTIPTSGLLAYYRFENSFGSSFGGAPTLQNHNGVGFTGGEVGSAASFNLGGYLTMNSGMPNYSQGGSLTTAAWIYLQSSRDDGGTGGNVEGRGVWAVGNNANRQRWYMRNYCNPDTHCYLALGIHDGDTDVWLSGTRMAGRGTSRFGSGTTWPPRTTSRPGRCAPTMTAFSWQRACSPLISTCPTPSRSAWTATATRACTVASTRLASGTVPSPRARCQPS